MRNKLNQIRNWIRQEHNYSIFKNKYRLTLVILLVVIFVFDIATTLIALKMGGIELNPIMRSFVNKDNPLMMIIIKGAYLGIIILLFNLLENDERTKNLSNYSMMFPLVVTSVAVGNNLFHLINLAFRLLSG